jgi:formylglycine-generating enzyme required for sulfatase activity
MWRSVSVAVLVLACGLWSARARGADPSYYVRRATWQETLLAARSALRAEPASGPLSMAGQRFEHGLHVYADSDVRIPLHGRYEHRGSWIFGEEYLGYPLDGPQQPVVRVSWHDAVAFCRRLSDRTGLTFQLPTEGQWEYACRAGSAASFWYGDRDTDFGPFANLADVTIRDLAYKSWNPRTPDLVRRDDRFDDHALVSAPVDSYRPNAWGLHDMHGNVAEWTRTSYRSYPYPELDGRNATDDATGQVVGGGSWRDRPPRSRSAARLSYPPYQRAFNVGFRVVCESS